MGGLIGDVSPNKSGLMPKKFSCFTRMDSNASKCIHFSNASGNFYLIGAVDYSSTTAFVFIRKLRSEFTIQSVDSYVKDRFKYKIDDNDCRLYYSGVGEISLMFFPGYDGHRVIYEIFSEVIPEDALEPKFTQM